MRKYFLFFPLLFVFLVASAQSKIPSEYQDGLDKLKNKQYAEASFLFRKFLDKDTYGNLSNYASLNLAESVLGLNQPSIAINTLQPLTNSNWGGREKAQYLLGIAYFKNDQNLEALRSIKKINSSELIALAENATYDFLKSESASFMVSNLEEFRDNNGYTGALRTVLGNQSILSASERAAFYELRGENKQVGNRKPVDEVLDIALILPFTDGSSEISQESFVFELFQGIDFGVNQLKNENFKINLLTFDSKRDLNHLQSLLEDPAVLAADVIIGPIYPDETEVVAAFAESEKIPFIHPLSNLGDRFGENKYSYLFRPSVNSLAEGIVKALTSQNWGKTVAIAQGGSTRDQLLSTLLSEKLSDKGFEVIRNQEVNSSTANEFFQDFNIRSGLDSTEIVEVDQVILLSDDPAIAQSTLFLFESVTASVPTLVMDSWLSLNFANYEMLETPNFYFISNNTLSFNKGEMSNFKTKFYNEYSTYPRINSSIGREIVYWLSTNLSQTKGFDLRKNLDENPFQQGQLTRGFNFQNGNNNQYVPVFRLESGELKPLN